MAFREFLQKAKEKGTDLKVISDIESFILGNMRDEGFTEAQIYSMPMSRLWDLWLAATSNTLEKDFSRIALALEKNPNLATSAEPTLKALTEIFENLANELEADLKKKERSDRQ